MRVLLLIALAALPSLAAAQVSGHASQTCRAFGERVLKTEVGGLKALQIDNDRHLHLERKARRLGSQAVTAVLSGHGALVLEIGPPVEVVFLCLLAGDKRALWFHWVPRRDAPSLAQCRRSAAAAECLQALLDIAERDLIELSSIRFQQSLEADAKAGNTAASTAFRETASAWRGYRDLACARRGADGSDEWRACMVDFTRRRYLDLQ